MKRIVLFLFIAASVNSRSQVLLPDIQDFYQTMMYNTEKMNRLGLKPVAKDTLWHKYIQGGNVHFYYTDSTHAKMILIRSGLNYETITDSLRFYTKGGKLDSVKYWYKDYNHPNPVVYKYNDDQENFYGELEYKDDGNPLLHEEKTVACKFTYDMQGRVTEITPVSAFFAYRLKLFYDDKNRLIKCVYPDGLLSRMFEYDEKGRVTKDIYGGTIYEYVYDTNGLIKTVNTTYNGKKEKKNLAYMKK
jgi:YD repeat-containing protein